MLVTERKAEREKKEVSSTQSPHSANWLGSAVALSPDMK